MRRRLKSYFFRLIQTSLLTFFLLNDRSSLYHSSRSSLSSLHFAILHRAIDRFYIKAIIEQRVTQLDAFIAKLCYKISLFRFINECRIHLSTTTLELVARLSHTLCLVFRVLLFLFLFFLILFHSYFRCFCILTSMINHSNLLIL